MEKRRSSFIQRFSTELYDIVKSKKPTTRVPYAGVVFGKSEIKNAIGALYDIFSSGWFAIGKNGATFESRFSKKLGLQSCVLTNSGSSANLLAIAALVELNYLVRGDEVLTPATTFPTTINPLLLYGLKPVLVDVELPSYTVSSKSLLRGASNRTRAIMLPHLNGSASYMPEIIKLANCKDWIVIEDCCDALGTMIDGRYAGTFGLVSTFSFYAAHHICLGEGGAVASNQRKIVEMARSLRDWGRATGQEVFNMTKGRTLARVGRGTKLPEDYEKRYSFTSKGYNLKPIDLQAAIGLAQLSKLKRFSEDRRRNHRILYQELSKFQDVLILPSSKNGVSPSWFTFPIVVKPDSAVTRKKLVDYLENNGIETRPILAGNILKQPAYKSKDFRVPQEVRNSDLILRNGFFIGVYPGLQESQLQKVTRTFDSFFRNEKNERSE